MTRILSELLGADEHRFRANVGKLEQASGHPNADIALTAELSRQTKAKLKELGLDPHDTTGPELYHALQVRFAADNERLEHKLLETSQQSDSLAAVAHTLRSLSLPAHCFALKTSVAKARLKKLPPKRTMKLLGYRSFDSMAKHEPVAALLAAARQLESPAWQKQFTESYKKLKASDFETRKLAIVSPASERWQRAANAVVASRRHTLLSFNELATVVIWPLAADIQPPAAATTTLILALQAINELRAASTFLKLYQVKPDFGTIVQSVATAEPAISAEILDRPLPWQIIQRYYARFKDSFNASVFEPHVQLEDLGWHSIERVLEHLEPSLSFWRGTSHLSLLHEREKVSLNIVDAAINMSNRLAYADRLAEHGQLALWHELLLRYLKHENIERNVISHLQAELVPQPALT